MARLRDDFALADPAGGDPFFVCDVPTDATPAEAQKRLEDVVAFWQKERSHPKYKVLAERLVERRGDYAEVLTDQTRRAAAEARVLMTRSASFAAALADLDNHAALLRQTYSGIPSSKVAPLRAIAEHSGVPEATFGDWLASHTVIDDRVSAALPWDAAVRRQVRSALDALAGAADADEPSRYRTLYTFLRVDPSAGPGDLERAHAAAVVEKSRRARDTVAALTEDLLAQIRTHLLTSGGRDRYAASLLADAADLIRPELQRAALLQAVLPAPSTEALVARVAGLGWSIRVADAREIVREVAQELHLLVEVTARLNLRVCAACSRPQHVDSVSVPGNGQDGHICQYCLAPLDVRCPACSKYVPTAAQRCWECMAELAPVTRPILAAARAQSLLVAGRPQAAAAALATAPGASGRRSPYETQVRDQVNSRIAAATSQWDQVHTHLQGRRVWTASTALDGLSNGAVDVVGPDGQTVPETREAIEALQEKVRQGVIGATVLPPAEAELFLTELRAVAVDSPLVEQALAGLPLEPARDVRAEVDSDGGVTVSWSPTPAAAGDVRYRVLRWVTWPREMAGESVVGATSQTHLEDAGAPGGTEIAYDVVAIAGSRTAERTRSEAVSIVRDVATVRAEQTSEGVVLTWPSHGLGAAEISVDRSVDPFSGISAPMRRGRAQEPGRYVDNGASPGVAYEYHVYARYRTRDGSSAPTPGARVSITAGKSPST